MAVRYIADIEQVLEQAGVMLEGTAVVSTRDRLVVLGVMGGIFLVLQLWASGLILGLLARLFI